MQAEKYYEMSRIQERHWWFNGRRFLIRSVLENLNLEKNISVLEIGCGTGANLSVLKQFGTVYAAEMDSFSREYARGKYGVNVEYGRLPDVVPFADKKFDLICMFDVLEHVDNDHEALMALSSRLNKNGRILLTVPATKWLFGRHDKMFHHFRRYSRQELNEKMVKAGFTLSILNYFNTLLFPFALLARLADAVFPGTNTTGMDIPPTAVNKLLYRIFISEKMMMEKFPLPFGLSLIAVASKP